MQFFYGSYYHPANSVGFRSISRTFRRGETKRQHLLHVEWALDGKIVASSQSAVLSALSGLIAAYSAPDTAVYSAGMLDNNGNVNSLLLSGTQSIGGIRVKSPISHGEIKGAQANTYLKYSFALEADFLYALPYDVMSFHEQLSFTSNFGGPIYVERIPAQGYPILQQVSDHSWYYATQSGSLTQSAANPAPMSPIFDVSYLRTSTGQAANITYTSPKTIRGVPYEYGVNWRYDYVSQTPLIGYPNAVG